MSNISVHVDIAPVMAMLERAERALARDNIGRALTGPVSDYLQERARERFGSEGDDASGPWAPLSWATVKIRQEQGYGSGPINRRTGDMMDYLLESDGELFSNEKRIMLRWPDAEPPAGDLGKKIQTAQGGTSDPPTVARPVIAADETDLQGVLMALGGELIKDMTAGVTL